MLQFLSSSSSLEVRVGPDEDRLSAAEHAAATSPRLSVCDPGGPLDMCHEAESTMICGESLRSLSEPDGSKT